MKAIIAIILSLSACAQDSTDNGGRTFECHLDRQCGPHGLHDVELWDGTSDEVREQAHAWATECEMLTPFESTYGTCTIPICSIVCVEVS